MSVDMHNDIKGVLLNEDEIGAIVSRLGAEISRDYAGKDPLIVSILRGSFIFAADLMRAITIPAEIDFMAVSSYGAGTVSSGTLTVKKDLDTDIEGRHVVIAEDILDTGLTLSRVVEMLEKRKPASIAICSFPMKDVPDITHAIEPEYLGHVVANEFVVGYGLDYAEHYRNLPYLGVLKPEVYS